MPRPKYPSDHRRWFRVAEDILDDPKLNALSLADQALYMKLLAVLNRQKSRDGWGHLDTFAACALARRERWAYALPAFDRLAAQGVLRLQCLDGGISYLIPKWPEHQGFAPVELRRDSVQTPSPTPTPKTTPTPTPHSPPKNAPSGARSLVLDRWSEVKEAASMYGREWRGEKPSEARISVMAARAAAEDSADQGVTLVHAVHGYMAFHRIVSGDYDPMSHFTPETIYRASKFEKYVEAYGNAIRSGLSPPFLAASPKPPKTFADHQQDENRKWFMENAYDNESAEPGSNRIGAAVLSLPVGRK